MERYAAFSNCNLKKVACHINPNLALKLSLHNDFFLKLLDQIKLIIFIVSKSFCEIKILLDFMEPCYLIERHLKYSER